MPPSKKTGPKAGEKKSISGIIQITRKGTGYVAWPTDEKTPPAKDDKAERQDLEIQTPDLRGALNGDTVEAELTSLFPPAPRARS